MTSLIPVTSIPGTIVSWNEDLDIAGIAVKTSIPSLQWIGPRPKQGWWVGVLGSPLGVSGILTTGIISSTNSIGSRFTFTAAINPGNSGGPLVDATGAVIGVNSAIASLGSNFNSQTGSIGLGFAIPINQARKTADQLIKNGKATYPVMGISVDMNYSGDGALIAKNAKAILAGGPAAKAGMKAGDIITSIDGRAITSPEELIVAIRARNVGDTIEVTFTRGKEVKTATMTLTAGK